MTPLRHLLPLSALGAAWLLTAWVAPAPAVAAPPSARPNVLFLAVDDLNDWTTLFAPDNPIRTPHLERLKGNHAVRTERWRYIRYADGTEELYDHAADPHEWRNLAGDPAHAAVVADHRRWIPTENAAAAPDLRAAGR